MSLRYLLWLLVLILLAFAGWQFLRALAAAKAEAAAGSAAGLAATATASAINAQQREDEGIDEDEAEGASVDYAPVLRSAAGASAAPPQASPAPEVFQLELENRRLHSELAAQQALNDRQQAEIRALRDELDALASQQQPGTSPEYSEALVLAGQGLGADAIAARCGISVAEAELVLSLSGGRGS